MYGFNKIELRVFKRLSAPNKIQNFLNTIPIIGPGGDTCYSPRLVLKHQRAHCLEGAIFAAAALRLLGHKPLLVDLAATKKDVDHVIAIFKIGRHWGAISHTNFPVLRYRDPVYRNLRELVMSYFNEYFLDNGQKTLRSYSKPLDLSKFDDRGWMTSDEEVWYIEKALIKQTHLPVISAKQVQALRKADAIEIKAAKLKQWK